MKVAAYLFLAGCLFIQGYGQKLPKTSSSIFSMSTSKQTTGFPIQTSTGSRQTLPKTSRSVFSMSTGFPTRTSLLPKTGSTGNIMGFHKNSTFSFMAGTNLPQSNSTGTPGNPPSSRMPPNMTFTGIFPNRTFPGIPRSTPAYQQQSLPSGFPHRNFTGGLPGLSMGQSTPGFPFSSRMPPNMTFPGLFQNRTLPGIPRSTPSYPRQSMSSGFPQRNVTGGFPGFSMGQSTPGFPFSSRMPPNMTFPGLFQNRTLPGIPRSTPSYPRQSMSSGFPQRNVTGGFPGFSMGQSTPGFPFSSRMPPNMTFPGLSQNRTLPGIPWSTPSYPRQSMSSGFPQRNFTGGFPGFSMGQSTPGFPFSSRMPPNMTFTGLSQNRTLPGIPWSTPSYPRQSISSGFPQRNVTGGFPGFSMGQSTPGFPFSSRMPPNMTFTGLFQNRTLPGIPWSTPSYPRQSMSSGFPQRNVTGGFPGFSMGQSTPGFPFSSRMPPNMTFPGLSQNRTLPGMPWSTPSHPRQSMSSGFPQRNVTGGFPGFSMGQSTPGFPFSSRMPPNITFPGSSQNRTLPGMPWSTPSYPRQSMSSGFPQRNVTGGFPGFSMGQSTSGFPFSSRMPPNMTFPGLSQNRTLPGIPWSTPSYPRQSMSSGFPQRNVTGVFPGFSMGQSTPGFPFSSRRTPNRTFTGVTANRTLPGIPMSTPPSVFPQRNVTGSFPGVSIGQSTGLPIISGQTLPPRQMTSGFPQGTGRVPAVSGLPSNNGTPGSAVPGFTRQPIVTGSTMFPTRRMPVYFPCERACPICQSLTKPGTCMAYDIYGAIKQTFRANLSIERNDALTELENMTGVWETTAYLRTCGGLKFYIDLYKDLDRTTKDQMKSFLNDVSSVSAAEVEKFPREMYSVMQPWKAEEVFRDMDAAMKAAVCKDLKYYDCLTREAISKRINCAKILLASGTSLDKNDVKSLLGVNNCTAWDKDRWNMTIRNFPDVLDLDCMKVCPADVLMENLKELQNFCGRLDRRVVRALADITTRKLKEKRKSGQSSQAERDDWIKLLSECGADPSFFNNVLDPKDTLKNADLSKVSPAEGMKFMEDALKTMSPSDFTKDEIVNAIGVLVNDLKTLRQMNDSQLEAAACEVCDKKDDIDKEDLIKFSEVIMSLPAFSNPASFDSSTFNCMGCMMAYMPTSSFDRIPDASLQSALSSGNVKNMSITSKTMGKKVLASAKAAFNRPNGDFTDDELQKMGGALSAFSTKEIDKIPVSSLTADVVKAFDSALTSDSSSSRSLKAKIVEKVRSQSGGLAMLITTGLATELPTSAIQDASASDFPGLTGDNGESNIKCNKKQAKFLMKIVKKELGEVSATNANYTLKRLSNMKNYLSGLTPDDIKNVAQDSTTCMDKLNTIAKASNMSRDQTKTTYQQYKICSDFDNTDKATLSSSTDSDSIDQIAPMVLAHHSSSELEKYGSSNCEAICRKLAEADTKQLTKSELKDKFNFCIKCLNKATSGDVTSDDLDKIGNVICGISASAAGRLDTSSINKYVPIAQYCSLDESTRSAMAQKALSSLNLSDVSTMTASSAIIVGNLMTEISEDKLNTIDKNVFSDVTDKVAKAFKKKEDTDKDREKNGFKMEKTSTDKSTEKTKKKKVLKAAINAKLDVRSPTGRRKRSATSLLCTDMQTLGTSGLSAITETQISNLDDQEFMDCAELLGSVTDWTSSQKDALLVVAKRATVWGSPSAWNASNVYSAGVIVQSLTTSEIDTLNIELDTISRLGLFDGWTETQKTSVFNNWLAAEKSNNPSTVTSSELRSLGHMSCGASTSQIGLITSSVYRDSADSVGEVTSCTDAQLYQWALLAKSEYGTDVTTWDSTTISNVGIVVGGLTGPEISTLSATQIDSIDANDISYIPASTFSGFTTSQILTFETAQAQATTTSQRSALNSEQLLALSTAAGVDFTASSLAAGMTVSIFATVITVCVSLTFMKIEV